MKVFDIETGPLPDEQLLRILPKFDVDKAVKSVGEFNASDVKVGNLTDPAKIEAKIDAAREKHRKDGFDYSNKVEVARAKHFDDFKEKAALSSLSGQVLAIGVLGEDGKHLVWTQSADVTEADMLHLYWNYLTTLTIENLVGFNCNSFDLPFLIRRSWLNDVDVPEQMVSSRYFPSWIIDLLDKWRLGNRMDFVGLAAIDQALGGPGKPEDTTGADFARLFAGTTEERESAIDYLKNDLDMTWRVANAMQVL